MVGGEGPSLGELLACLVPLSSALSLSFVTSSIVRGRAGAARCLGWSSCLHCSSVHPADPQLCALQGRLLQTKKSGYFPSSSVKPCPVDARVGVWLWVG